MTSSLKGRAPDLGFTLGVEPKNRGVSLPPEMDGLFHGTPYEQMDDLGGFYSPIFGSTPTYQCSLNKMMVQFSEKKKKLRWKKHPSTGDAQIFWVLSNF